MKFRLQEGLTYKHYIIIWHLNEKGELLDDWFHSDASTENEALKEAWKHGRYYYEAKFIEAQAVDYEPRLKWRAEGMYQGRGIYNFYVSKFANNWSANHEYTIPESTYLKLDRMAISSLDDFNRVVLVLSNRDSGFAYAEKVRDIDSPDDDVPSFSKQQKLPKKKVKFKLNNLN